MWEHEGRAVRLGVSEEGQRQPVDHDVLGSLV